MTLIGKNPIVGEFLIVSQKSFMRNILPKSESFCQVQNHLENWKKLDFQGDFLTFFFSFLD